MAPGPAPHSWLGWRGVSSNDKESNNPHVVWSCGLNEIARAATKEHSTSIQLLFMRKPPDPQAQQQSCMLALHVASPSPEFLVLDNELTTTLDATILEIIGLSERPIAAETRCARPEPVRSFPCSELAGNTTIAPTIP
jgi:hypothetical protein